MRRSAENRRRSNAARALIAAAALATASACTCSGARAQAQQYLGPRSLYPAAGTFTNHKNIPVVMRDAIQAIAIGTRLLAVKPRIMGGELAPFGLYPWAASIGLKSVEPREGHFCAGAFIAPDWLITAAHCLSTDAADKIEVYGGSNNLETGGKVFPVDRVVIHEKYDAETQQNDIALVHLTERYTGELLRLIPPADAERLSGVGALAAVLGWGIASEGLVVRNAQRRITVQIFSNQTCNGLAAYAGAIGDGMLCAGFPADPKDSCQGDSGSPLAVGDGIGNRYLVGVASWGEGCSRPMKFGVYTRVAKYVPWIEEKIGGRSAPVAINDGPPATRAAPQMPPGFVGPILPRPADSPAVRSVMREPPAPRGRNGSNGSQLTARLPQLGPRKLYPQAPRDTGAVPLPIRDAESFIATGRRLFAVRPRIVGGEPAAPGAYPWTASLELKNQRSRNAHFCGAAFISPEWVLTAAHCVTPESAGAIEVLGGSTELDRGGKLYPVDRIIVHEKYDAGTQDYDVALVHLSSRYDGPTIKPITPAQARELAAPGEQAVVAGWGLTAEGTNVSDILRRVNVEIQSPASCNAQAAYGGTVNSELMLCAGFAQGGKDACQGDSGGPLMVMDRAGGFLQAGIVSWGEGCARPNRFGVYTRVSAVEPWIAEHTGVRQAQGPRAPPLPRSAPNATRIRAIEPDAARPPRTGVRSNSRVELPGNLRAQAKKTKHVTRHKPALRHRAADSRAEVDDLAAMHDPRFLSPGMIP